MKNGMSFTKMNRHKEFHLVEISLKFMEYPLQRYCTYSRSRMSYVVCVHEYICYGKYEVLVNMYNNR